MDVMMENRDVVVDYDELSPQWNAVAPFFSQNMSPNSNYFPGKDNYDNAWPFLYSVISTQLNPNPNEDVHICDFGCGTGTFAEQLSRLKLHTYACDFSTEMILQAKKHTKGEVVYEVGSTNFLYKYSPFDMIVAVMVFQFVPNLEEILRTMAECVGEDGLLFFAVHHIDYAYECARNGIKFRMKNTDGDTEEGQIFIGNRWIKTFVRSPSWYDGVLSKVGFTRVGYTLSDNNPPEEAPKIEGDRWTSSKYYIAWYKKR